MDSIWTTRIKALPFGLKQAFQLLIDRIRGAPDRRQAALDFAREHATAGDPESILRTLDRFARDQRFLMNVGDEKGPLLEEAVRTAGASARVLELGSFVGYSAILMARHLGPEGRLVSIDVNATASRVSGEMAALAGVAERVEFLTGKSSDVLDTLDSPFDVVFIDHWKGLYRSDMEKILKRDLLRPDAVVLADNVGPLFGENDYVPWMQARDDFESRMIQSHVEYEKIPDAVLISRWRG